MAAEQQPYTIKQGDTLSAIYLKFYGNANKYPQVAKANRVDANHIAVARRSAACLRIAVAGLATPGFAPWCLQTSVPPELKPRVEPDFHVRAKALTRRNCAPKRIAKTSCQDALPHTRCTGRYTLALRLRRTPPGRYDPSGVCHVTPCVEGSAMVYTVAVPRPSSGCCGLNRSSLVFYRLHEAKTRATRFSAL